MTYRQVILSSIALAALGGCDDRSADSRDANLTAESSNSVNVASAANPAADETAFANKVASSDQFEIESGTLAAGRSASAEVKAFGSMLVTDHRKSSADLKVVVGDNATLAPALEADQSAKLAALKAANGAAFDRLFLEQQVEAHGKAYQMLTDFAADGSSEQLRSFATKVAPVVKQHLDKAKAIQAH